MKKLILFAIVALSGLDLAQSEPSKTAKDPDPYDEDLIKVLKPVVDLDKGGDVSDRRQAITRLGKLVAQFHNLQNALAHRLTDRDEAVRVKAAEALADMGPSARGVVDDLVKALGDPSGDVRYWSARALGIIGPVVSYGGDDPYGYVEITVAALTRALKDKSKKVRLEAAWALGRLGPFAKPAVPALLDAMREDDAKDEKIVTSGGSIRWRAMRALADIGPEAKEAIPALLKVVQNGEGRYVHGCAVIALGKIAPEDPKVLAALLAAAKVKDLRGPAVYALGNVGRRHADKVIPTLIQALDVSDIEDKVIADSMQRTAIRGLIRLGPAAKVALPKIEEILKNPKTGTSARSEAERAAKQMRD